MTEIAIFVIPYDSGAFEVRQGLGPGQLLRDGLKERLEADGHAVNVQMLTDGETFSTEIGTSFRLLNRLSLATDRAVNAGSIPLVLAGNCNASVGAAAGVGMNDLALFWLDGNADFNTPETTRSGFLDGMGLAMLNGRCWTNMLSGLSGFTAIPDHRLMLLGARDFDPAEAEALSRTGIVRIEVEEMSNGEAEAAIARMASLAQRAFIHLDVDVHDPVEAPANRYQPADGPSISEVRHICCTIANTIPLAGITVASYDPAYDPSGTTSRGMIETLAMILSSLRPDSEK